MESEDIHSAHIVMSKTLWTTRLIEKLELGKAGDVLTDEDLEKICGKDCRAGKPGYGYLASATRHVLRSKRLVWKRVLRAGAIKCLGPTETVVYVESNTRSIHRSGKRNLLRLATVDAGAMTDEGRRDYYTQLAQLGTATAITSREAARRFAVRPAAQLPALPELMAAIIAASESLSEGKGRVAK